MPYIVVMKRKGPVTKLKERLNVAQKESKENFDSYLRSLADLDNYRKRMEKEVATFKVYANEQLLSDLTIVMDNFSRALDSGSTKAEGEDFCKGISMIYRYLKEILERWGLKEYSAAGEVFDPQRHDAVSVVETNDLEPNTIVEEVSKGYMLGEKILKPAQVTVARACPEKKEEGGNQNG